MVMNDITVTNSKLGGKYVFITMCNNTESKVKVKGKDMYLSSSTTL